MSRKPTKMESAPEGVDPDQWDLASLIVERAWDLHVPESGLERPGLHPRLWTERACVLLQEVAAGNLFSPAAQNEVCKRLQPLIRHAAREWFHRRTEFLEPGHNEASREGVIPQDPRWCSRCRYPDRYSEDRPCPDHRGPDGKAERYQGPGAYEPSEWVLGVVGGQYRAFGTGKLVIYLCEGYDPREGFWMVNPATGEQRNISPNAIEKTFLRHREAPSLAGLRRLEGVDEGQEVYAWDVAKGQLIRCRVACAMGTTARVVNEDRGLDTWWDVDQLFALDAPTRRDRG